MGSVLAVIAAVLMWLFVADYARWRWWDNPGGRLVMTVAVALALVLTLASLRSWWPEFPGHELARVVVYLVASGAIVFVWAVHWSSQRGKHRAKR
ncbi:hypothetical protein ADL05_26115 [Nocardiopsis sp. NRRL B-16309]|nr:hypothetical protein ADL05_26115 [Nocardiopsis sp. NRRL B-16309]